MQTFSARGQYGAADLHLHTCYSDGRPTPEELVRHVAAAGRLQIIAVTDHNTIEGARAAAALAPRYGVACIVGEEVSSSSGHIVGLFLRDAVPRGLSPAETIAAIHGQGGLAFAPHPFFRPRRPRDVPNFPTMESVAERLPLLPFDAVETINATPFLGGVNRETQRFNRAHTRLPELGCSDAHILDAVGKGYTLFPGETVADLRQAIVSGQTVALANAYTIGELMSYLHFWVRTSVARGGLAW